MAAGTASSLIFWIPSYQYLGRRIARKLKAGEGEIEYRAFPDGERYLRILSETVGRDIVLVSGTIDDRSTLDAFDLACGLVSQGCRSLTMIFPFFGYSTMERAVKTGEVVTAKTRARLFSSIPGTPNGNRIILLDLHAEGIPYYFEGDAKTHHLYAKPLVLQEARKIGGKKDFVLACVDAGRAKWVESLANDLGVPAGFVYKRRGERGKTEITGVNVRVEGKKVIIYDDMIRTGGSVINACRAYRDAGASSVSVIATHGLFSAGALKSMRDSGMIAQLVCTDSHPAALAQSRRDSDGFLRVVSTDSLLVSFLRDLEVSQSGFIHSKSR